MGLSMSTASGTSIKGNPSKGGTINCWSYWVVATDFRLLLLLGCNIYYSFGVSICLAISDIDLKVLSGSDIV